VFTPLSGWRSFTPLDRGPGWREFQGNRRFLQFDVTSSRRSITALNPATPPPDTCFQIPCGMRQSGVKEFIKMRGDFNECVGIPRGIGLPVPRVTSKPQASGLVGSKSLATPPNATVIVIVRDRYLP